MWQQRAPHTRLVREESRWPEIFAMDADDHCKTVENEASVKNDENTDEHLTEPTTPDNNDLNNLVTTTGRVAVNSAVAL